MARQRFIWPSIWDDPDLASISTGAMLLYIACFSLADDEGRLDGNPVHLRSRAFPYRPIGVRTVRTWKSEVEEVCPNFHCYVVDGREYIAFLNWREFQKPKYPSPSKLPPPPGHSGSDSGNGSGTGSGNDSVSHSPTGRDGLGSTPLPPTEKTPKRRRRRATATTPGHVSDPTAGHPHPCPHCTRRYPTKLALDEHLVNVHDHRLTADQLHEIRARLEDTPA